ncbi:MAG: reverse transcriptase N-terminal domain-containing protein, partial [Deltaproteobacteria bacterium]|nr:reverse transcriptase N-terminal domain-containing protein [Deltaproteobacteria bacterium]
KALQYLLTRSFYAKVLAVKRVTSNKGKKTPGVDGVLWQGARARWRAACSLRAMNAAQELNSRAARQELPFERLEPCDGKLSRRVLRGKGVATPLSYPVPPID